MVLTRRTRTLMVFALLGTAASTIVAPRLLPAYFNHETSMGYVAEYTSDTRAVILGEQLSEPTWAKVKEQCDIEQSHLVPTYAISTFTHEVFCRTRADRERTLLSYLVVLLIFPVLALLIDWALRSESSGERM